MHTKNFLFFLTVLFSATLTAQNLSGKLVDETNAGLPGATAAAYKNDSLIAGTVSDFDGNFTLTLTPGNYQIRFSFVSYQAKNKQVEMGSTTQQMGTIQLQPATNQLEEATVEVEASTMTFEQDKRVYNVGADLVNLGMNASDILNNIPSVATDVEGNVSLRGSQNVRILINGKPSGLIGTNPAEALRLLQGSQIERVEVITNPSARYDAEGEAGIINIILKKEQKRGFNGNFELSGGYPDNYGASAGLNYRTNKINFFGNLGVNYRKSPGGGSSEQRFFGDTNYTFLRDRSQVRGGTSGTVNLGIDYYFTPKTSITTSFLYRPSLGNNVAILTYDDFDDNDVLVKQTRRQDDEVEKERTLEGDVHVEHQFGENDKHKLTADFKFQDSDDRETSDIVQTSTTANENFLQFVNNQEDEQNILVQADYVKPFGEKHSIEMGTRATFRTVLNNFLVQQGDSTIDRFSNNFEYLENIAAAYFIYNNSYNKLTYQAGLRAEYTDISTASINVQESVDKQYLNFFPSASITYKLNKTNDVQASYSRRLSRPGFRSLLPFSNFSDNRNIYRGNPDLNPEFTDSYEMGFMKYWPKITLYSGIYYRHRTGVIDRIILVDSVGQSTFLPVNLSVQDAYGLEFNYNHKLSDWWNLSANVNVYQAITVGSFEGIDYGNTNFSAQGRVSNRWDFWQSSFQANANLRAPETTAQGSQKGIYTLDLAWSKELLDKKATLTFSVNDLFNSRRRRSITTGENFESTSDFQWRQRQFLLTFTYRINQQKKRPNRTQGAGGAGDEGI